ncbi:Nramp family divalent metal transporter [uncultured Nonlabens sp.]|uniref:Nramp family divalent metal transporter n=1 Tax=uncultured Nonlabens sp. TaxID=859306 RepID=UPI0030DB306B|tara:strand:+ start:25008 stop:26204 length:1197 start_codon:yes stop_codon:yes gene_type:complete
MFRNLFKNIGPATLIAAAFVGPGTVTVCTLAGANYGYSLLWALLLSIFATIILQEMAARLGLITGKGLPEILRSAISNKIIRVTLIVLVLAAIAVGNTAYEAGNLSGGVLGLQTIFGAQWYFPLLLGAIAFALLFYGNYKVLEKVLISLVVIMGASFIATAIAIGPDFKEVFQGLFTPQINSDNILTIVGLIGTTVVPYNLFLHASLVSEKWNMPSDLSAVRKDTVISVVLGGLVSMAIIIAATALQGTEVAGGAALASALEPVYGSWATYVFSVGILAAGITSAITAPLAAAYVVKGCLGWKGNMKSWSFRGVWIFILVIGVLFSSIGLKPLDIITFAQIANGLLLPIIAILLLWLVNQKLLGPFQNKLWQNIMAVIVILIAVILGAKTLLKVFELI